MDNKLRIDLDKKSKNSTINQLTERIEYLNHLKYLDIKNIKKIELIWKKTFGCLITLNKKCSMDYIFKTELLLGDDYKKSCCAMINHYKLGMVYSNRLFTHKKYPNGSWKVAKIIDVTKIIFDEIEEKIRYRKEYIKDRNNNNFVFGEF